MLHLKQKKHEMKYLIHESFTIKSIKYIKQILVKIEITAPIQQAKQIIQNEIQGVASQRPYNTAQFQLDVDPI